MSGTKRKAEITYLEARHQNHVDLCTQLGLIAVNANERPDYVSRVFLVYTFFGSILHESDIRFPMTIHEDIIENQETPAEASDFVDRFTASNTMFNELKIMLFERVKSKARRYADTKVAKNGLAFHREVPYAVLDIYRNLVTASSRSHKDPSKPVIQVELEFIQLHLYGPIRQCISFTVNGTAKGNPIEELVQLICDYLPMPTVSFMSGNQGAKLNYTMADAALTFRRAFSHTLQPEEVMTGSHYHNTGIVPFDVPDLIIKIGHLSGYHYQNTKEFARNVSWIFFNNSPSDIWIPSFPECRQNCTDERPCQGDFGHFVKLDRYETKSILDSSPNSDDDDDTQAFSLEHLLPVAKRQKLSTEVVVVDDDDDDAA